MDMSKIWLVTGASSGIGAGIVKAALQAGERVVATGRSMEKLRAEFPEGEHDSLALIELDVTDKEQATAAVADAVERFGRIDVVVNNAGYCVLGNFEDLTAADFGRQLDTNFFGVVHVLHAALPVMRKQRAGHIINISSVAGAVGMAHCSAYSASKFALEGLSMAVAAEVERFGIKVTIVEPGFFRTDFLNKRNAVVIDSKIKDYAGHGTTREAYAAYDGTQLGDPLKLGHALLEIAAMETPLKLFIAGSDAIEMLRPAAEDRLRAITRNVDLSCSTDRIIQ
jgi:NAD(P)-dependent dehydrogenase (short-subunit alcohol dehydrogenase family)